MHETAKKSIHLWTEQHEIFCLKNKVPHAAQRLWQWLLWQSDLTEEIEPDLSEFNTWVEKWRGRRYTHNYLKSMFQLLNDLRVISVVKTYCWKIHRLILRPLDWLNPRKRQPKKNLQVDDSTYNYQPPNDECAVSGVIQQQQLDIDLNKGTLDKEGIEFNSEETEVLVRPNWELRAAIVLFKIRGGFEKIDNPEGWIRRCLQSRYWETCRNYFAIIRYTLGLSKNESMPAIELEDLFKEDCFT